MIEVDITEAMVSSARERAEKPTVIRSAIPGGGLLEGFLGEEVANTVLQGDIVNTYDYDIILDAGETVDVKTKRVTSAPLTSYSCSVMKTGFNQNCDYYAFVRVLKNLKTAWYLGSIKKGDFFTEATFHKKGEYDPTNNYTFRANCYNIPIESLGQ